MTNFLLRGGFLVTAVAVAALYAIRVFHDSAFALLLTISVAIVIALAAIFIDYKTQTKKLSALSGAFLGLGAGMLITYCLSYPIAYVLLIIYPSGPPPLIVQGVVIFIGAIVIFGSVSVVLQTRDDFRFIIPYVEFAKQMRGTRPMLLDTSAIIDGRVLDVAETHILQGLLIVPRFVLNELQTIADSADKIKRSRGRRGLDIVARLQNHPLVDVTIEDAEAEGATVDQQLVSMAQDMHARLITTDYNLNKVARLRGVDVININELANAMKPVVLPGEKMSVEIIKPGEGPTQGVGYLEDGTMVVVENTRECIGRQVSLIVTSMLQTSAGRMIFGKPHTPQNHSENTEANGIETT